MASDFRDIVMKLHNENKWNEILDLEGDCDSGLLWVWPSKKNLYFIQEHLYRNGCSGVTSIGCGCGLLEWLLQKCTGVAVQGFEVNEKWWKSKYSTTHFIQLQFAEPFPQNCPAIGEDQALLFCYFNNHEAFLMYLRRYCGCLLFIIGPGAGRYTHTDPQPFKPNFETLDWVLVDFEEVKCTKDYIAVYRKITDK